MAQYTRYLSNITLYYIIIYPILPIFLDISTFAEMSKPNQKDVFSYITKNILCMICTNS